MVGASLCLFGSSITAQTITTQQMSVHGTEQECTSEPTPAEMAYMDRNAHARQNYPLNAKAATIYLPVRHIIVRRSNGTGGITNSQLSSAMTQLNNKYASANVQFYECSRKYVNSDTYYNFDKTEESALASGNEVAKVINVFHCNTVTSGGRSLCGYAYFPSSSRDRIVMKNSCTMNGSTFIHEFGHYLSLYHTHQSGNELVNGSNCTTAGDRICDTPADPQLSYSNVNSSCNYTGSSRDANNALYVPNPRNIMSYSRKECRDYFSPGQVSRIRYSAVNDRDDLSCPSQDPMQYAKVPYSTTFNSSSLDQYWLTQSDNEFGRVRYTTSYGPYTGSRHIVMDSRQNGRYATNQADLRVNLAGCSNVNLYFRWKEFNDENHSQDGVYFSDNGGQSFVKIFDLTGGANNTWNSVNIDLDQAVSSKGRSLTSKCIIRFQQYDNYGASTDGIAIDYVRVLSCNNKSSALELEAQADHQLGPIPSKYDAAKDALEEFAALNQEMDQVDLTVFPNPAQDVLHLQLSTFDMDQTVTIKLVNMLGAVQYNSRHIIQDNHTDVVQLNVEQLPAGVYTVVIEQDQRVVAHRQVVLQR